MAVDERPRYRRDLLTTTVEADGAAWVEIADPTSGRSFRLYDFEHTVAQTFDGRSLADVAADASKRAGQELTVEQLRAFAKELAQLGFLEADEAPTPEVPEPLAIPDPAPIAEKPAIIELATAPMAPVVAEMPVAAIAAPKDALPARKRPSPALFALLGLAAAAGIIAIVFKPLTQDEPEAIAVRTVVPALGSVYRWFDAAGTVKPAGERTLTFPSAGTVAHVLATGAPFVNGDVIAALDTARRFQNDLAHNRERLAYYQQMLESMRTAGNKPEMRQAEIKIAEKKRMVVDTLDALSNVAIVATFAGEVGEALTTVGATVKAGAGAVRIKGNTWRVEFELSREDADRVRHLGFCRVDIEGKPLECSLGTDGDNDTHILVDLPPDPAVMPGKVVRLAKARFDGVFTIPTSAVVQVGNTDRVYIAAPTGRAEFRPVALAERSPSEALVTQGLDVGDVVVVDVPNGLHQNAKIQITETRRP